MTVTVDFDPLVKLSKDIKDATVTLSPGEVRYLVDAYYQMQENRKRGKNQILSMSEEPHQVLDWLTGNNKMLERSILRALDAYTDYHPVGAWAKDIVGIGPVISAGLLAHIDISKAPTVGHIWRFAGLDPTMEWKNGQKRPWNARLKTLAWKIGESFVKVCNHDDDIYGRVYIDRKELEIARNEQGEFADQAAEKLRRFNIGKDTDAYKHYIRGKLPPAHVHARAKRYATKLFLSHFHYVLYEYTYGMPPPKPFILNQPGHTHFLRPPLWP